MAISRARPAAAGLLVAGPVIGPVIGLVIALVIGLAIGLVWAALGPAGPAGAAAAAAAPGAAAAAGAGSAAQPVPACSAGTCTVSYAATGAAQTFTVPSGITSVSVTLTGGNGYRPVNAGRGAVVTGTVAVTAGEQLQVGVGGGGTGETGGFNGGGGGVTGSGAGGGGGASDVRVPDGGGAYPLTTRVLIAGGGGGSAKTADGGNAGASGTGTAPGSAGQGGAGTPSAGGGGGAGYSGDTSGAPGGSPTQDLGGAAGGTSTSVEAAGAGGGGYWGGGGGGGGGTSGHAGAGGGGSSYIGTGPTVTGASVTGTNPASLAPGSTADGAAGTVTVSYTYPAPTVTKVAPTSGTSAGGTAVTISGTGLTGATAVTFGGTVAASFTVVGDTSITATTPAHAAGLVDTVVTGRGARTSATAAADGFTFVAPVATTVAVAASPGSVPADAKTTSTLTASVRDQFGALFPGTSVTFTASDPTAKLGAVADSGATHTATLTAGTTAGSVTITATTTSGTRVSGTAKLTQTARPVTPSVPAATVTLVASATFVPIGTDVAYTGTVIRSGARVPGASVALSETYVDGKTVQLGVGTTAPDGTFRITSHPLYIGQVTARSLGGAASVPSRVIVTYRSARASVSGRTVTVHAETRPGFVTSPTRQERAQILAVDAAGRQLAVLAVVNAAQRQFFPGEAQGTNALDATLTLRPGSYRIVVKIIGTPVNTGASSRQLPVTVR